MKHFERNFPPPCSALDLDDGIERDQRDAEIGRMRRDAVFAPTHDGVKSVLTVAGVAARALIAFIARTCDIVEARLALGGVAMKPWRAREAELVLAGAKTDASIFRRAAEAALAQAKPSGDNGFKIELARRIVVRALLLALAGTPERVPALPASPFAAVSGGVVHA